MEIFIQQTPNPNARKFVISGMRFEQSMNFSSAEAAVDAPLAAQLFMLDGVYNVFLAQDFVTVNKLPDTPWEPLTAQIQAEIAACLANGAEKYVG